MAAPERFVFRKQNRVLARGEFLFVYDHAKVFRRTAASVFVLRREDTDGPARLGITATKKIGNAVVRNRLKRYAREIFRLTLPELKGGFTTIVNYHRAAPGMKYDQVQRQLHSAWREAGMFRDEADRAN